MTLDASRDDSADRVGVESALEDCTVLDLSLQLPGPYATMLLGSLGARVIKVEPPGGDPARVIDGRMFGLLNAGKESIELDLRHAEHRDALHRIARHCDVLVEGFRPGVAARLGFDYETIARIRPDVIYCSISGYGQDGPYRGLPGHDLNYLGVGGGVRNHRMEAGLRAEAIGIPMVDLATGTNASLSILAAVRRRDRTGMGQYLDVAMLDTAVFWSSVKGWGSTAREPAYAALEAADGRWLTVAVIEDKFWRQLCEVLDWRDWLESPEFADHIARQQRADEILARLRSDILRRPRAFWLRVFAEHDVPAAPLHEGDEVVHDPQVVERGLLRSDAEPARPPLPVRASAREPRPAPWGNDGAGDLDELIDTLRGGPSARATQRWQREAGRGGPPRDEAPSPACEFSLPPGRAPATGHPALVVCAEAGEGAGVGEAFAAQGLAALTLHPTRFPSGHVEAIRAALTWLQERDGIDGQRLGAVGLEPYGAAVLDAAADDGRLAATIAVTRAAAANRQETVDRIAPRPVMLVAEEAADGCAPVARGPGFVLALAGLDGRPIHQPHHVYGLLEAMAAFLHQQLRR